MSQNCNPKFAIWKTKWQSSLVGMQENNPMTRNNELLVQSYSKMLSLPQQLSIQNWHSLSNCNGITFTLLYGVILSSVYIVDLLCHACVVYQFWLLISGLVVIRFSLIDHNLIWILISFLLLKYKRYICSIWLRLVRYDRQIGWLCWLYFLC